MVKKLSHKVSKFIIEIDKVVKKKDAKIKKQKGIIKALKNDPKNKKHKVTILSLQGRLADVENELRRYKVGRVTITNKTVENAFKNLRNGQSLFKGILYCFVRDGHTTDFVTPEFILYLCESAL